MKPYLKSNVPIFSIVCVLALCLNSCELKQQQILDDANIRVIELDKETPNVPTFELEATSSELSRYDCDVDWILFDYNSDKLSNSAKLELEKVALIISLNVNFKARIRAFTDSKGRREYNEKLSARRAQRAKRYLISEGVSAKNISIASFADTKPIALNTEDDTGRRFNRRIELFILDKLNNTVCRSHAPEIPKALKVEIQ